MGEAAELLGHGTELRVNGSVHPLGVLTFDDYARFSTWIEREAWLAWERSGQWLSPSAHAQQGAGLRQDIAGKLMEYGQPVFLNAMQSVTGTIQLLALALRHHNKDVDEATAEGLCAEDMKAVREALAKVTDDPKAVMRSLTGRASR